MGRTNKTNISTKQKSKTKETIKTETTSSKQNNNLSVMAQSLHNIIETKGNHEKSASDVVGTVAGIIGGTMAGALIWPIGMLLTGPVGGTIIGAGAAGLFGVAVQEVFSKHVQQIEWLLCCLGILVSPILIHLFSSGTETFEYYPDEEMPRRFMHKNDTSLKSVELF